MHAVLLALTGSLPTVHLFTGLLFVFDYASAESLYFSTGRVFESQFPERNFTLLIFYGGFQKCLLLKLDLSRNCGRAGGQTDDNYRG